MHEDPKPYILYYFFYHRYSIMHSNLLKVLSQHDLTIAYYSVPSSYYTTNWGPGIQRPVFSFQFSCFLRPYIKLQIMFTFSDL